MRRTIATPPEVGEVVPYWYLWRSEFDSGEESGRKLRPCAVVAAIKTSSGETRVALLPVTHAEPPASRRAVEIPALVKEKLGLDAERSWIVCDEANEFVWPGFDIAKTASGHPSYGFLPRGLLAKVRSEFVAARQDGRLKSVERDD